MSNLLQRILTAVVGIPIVLALVYVAPPYCFTLLIIAVAFVCAREFFKIVAQDSRRLTWFGPCVSSAIVAALGFFPEHEQVWATVMAVLPVFSLIVLLVKPGDLRDVPPRAGSMALGLLYTGVLPALLAVIHRTHEHGPDLVILTLCIVFLGDTGAYTAGRIFGKHPLYPVVSPKKTWEGSFGGIAFSVIAPVVAHFWFLPELPLVYGIGLAVFLGILGQIGDLCESMIKRAFDVKDSGALLPGHGGMLDRVDGVLFAVAGLYLFHLWLGPLAFSQ